MGADTVVAVAWVAGWLLVVLFTVQEEGIRHMVAFVQEIITLLIMVGLDLVEMDTMNTVAAREVEVVEDIMEDAEVYIIKVALEDQAIVILLELSNQIFKESIVEMDM